MDDTIENTDEKNRLAFELSAWWHEQAQSEVNAVVPKAIEYGGHGAAIDLLDIGRNLARLMGRNTNLMSDAEITELGIYFYLQGKFSRWTAALLEGRKVSDDTIHDISVYCRMVARTRAVGGWPFKGEG